jgi:hypothetical protein
MRSLLHLVDGEVDDPKPAAKATLVVGSVFMDSDICAADKSADPFYIR